MKQQKIDLLNQKDFEDLSKTDPLLKEFISSCKETAKDFKFVNFNDPIMIKSLDKLPECMFCAIPLENQEESNNNTFCLVIPPLKKCGLVEITFKDESEKPKIEKLKDFMTKSMESYKTKIRNKGLITLGVIIGGIVILKKTIFQKKDETNKSK